MNMPENKNMFDKFATLMDQNIIGVQYGVYIVAGAGFVIAMRSVRPLKKFVKPWDIPKHFVEKRMKFSGKVVKIQGDCLYIDHYPVVPLPFRRQPLAGLAVKISSIQLTPNAGIWLNSILKGKEIDFIPLKIDNEFVESIVLNKKQDVGQHLVSIGFATAVPLRTELKKDAVYSKYHKSLIASQRRAQTKGDGVWLNRPFGKHLHVMNVLDGRTELRKEMYLLVDKVNKKLKK